MGAGHDHHQQHAHGNNHAARNLLVALLLNLSFAIIELFGGVYTNSVAIMSDALHDFGDALSLGVAWYLQRVSMRPRDRYYSYGYRRFSLLGALVVSSVLLIGIAMMVRESIGRLIHPETTNAKGMLALAIFGIAVNGYAALRLRSGHSFNERAVFLHLIEDVLGWVAVLFTSVVMIFVHVPALDPIISIAISVLILVNVFRNLRGIVKILLLETPQHLDLTRLESQIAQLKGVSTVEDLHVWTLDGERHVVTLQVVVKGAPAHVVLTRLKLQVRKILAEHGIAHSTIEFCNQKEDLQVHD